MVIPGAVGIALPAARIMPVAPAPALGPRSAAAAGVPAVLTRAVVGVAEEVVATEGRAAVAVAVAAAVDAGMPVLLMRARANLALTASSAEESSVSDDEEEESDEDEDDDEDEEEEEEEEEEDEDDDDELSPDAPRKLSFFPSLSLPLPSDALLP